MCPASLWASLVAQMVKNLPVIQETWVQSLCWEVPLKEGMAPHSSILAWRIPWTEEPGRLQSMGLQRAGHDSATKPQPLTDTTTWMNLWRIMLSEKKPILYTIIFI